MNDVNEGLRGRMSNTLPLTAREIRLLLTWSEGKQAFPDEARVRRKLARAAEAGGTPVMSRVQLQILHAWAEEWWGTPYGGGEVVNPEEQAILAKIRAALGWD